MNLVMILKMSFINQQIKYFLKVLLYKEFSAEWIQNFLGHASYKTTMDMYGTLSIDEMQQEAEKRLQG